MFWLAILLLGGLAVAAVSSRPVTEEDVTAVVNHAILAERDPTVILDLQHVLSAAGRFKEAELMRDRWQSLTQELFHETEKVVSVAPITATVTDPRAERALEWSRMYGITIEEAYRRMAERGL